MIGLEFFYNWNLDWFTNCIGFPGFSNSPHPRRLVWHTYVITFLIIFHPINAESFIYEGYIGPLPPYPFLTFTLMQLLLYVFFLLLSFIYEPFGSYICIWMKSNYDWLKMKSAQLNMLYSHLDLGQRNMRGGVRSGVPSAPPPRAPIFPTYNTCFRFLPSSLESVKNCHLPSPLCM